MPIFKEKIDHFIGIDLRFIYCSHYLSYFMHEFYRGILISSHGTGIFSGTDLRGLNDLTKLKPKYV